MVDVVYYQCIEDPTSQTPACSSIWQMGFVSVNLKLISKIILKTAKF